jgi:hypothetical protein
MDHGMETRMRLRGHFIGALTLAFVSFACASANAKCTQHFASSAQILVELSDLSDLHTAR